ncbi:hypothetical protein CONPUDRAFT_82059 [Coniophora puteana RWD-64-598 SS2]|uniref:histone acetyltransferase n=1 Tax=Coniophora puteana (strain RWD-64-598) TaxID=741705 RepID=A0A5M3MP38_CONPW|nr:uncharacterized protein CONPUDRAFT_82059 [Coniophora puteana RWD-64-598 SS2]EIW80942.1 hypothetical protein CONPUDRAFT_82059 [Coniophora puteana RWD-64-598 SS2]
MSAEAPPPAPAPTASASAPTPPPGLRDALLDALKDLPGRRTLHLHVLVSAPKRNASLFPFVHPRPRVYAQEILVLLSEHSEGSTEKEADDKPDAQPTQPEPGASQTQTETHAHAPDTPSHPPRNLVSAISATLFHLPHTSSALLYVSKVDSTGHGDVRPAPTRALVCAFLAFYASPRTRPAPVAGTRRLWVHVFARAQGQYLFPNSAEWTGKRVRDGTGLCKWWRGVCGEVAKGVRGEGAGGEEKGKSVRLWYLLPGMTDVEAAHSLGVVGEANDPDPVQWVYGNPYGETELAYPCSVSHASVAGVTATATTEDTDASGSSSGPAKWPHLGYLIPSFDDDPKSRFLDELAYTTDADGVRSPERKRPRLASDLVPIDPPEGSHKPTSKRGGKPVSKRQDGGAEKEKEKDDKERGLGELGRVSLAEFWERMAFRQECISGTVTGFFVMLVDAPPLPHAQTQGQEADPAAANPGEVSAQLAKRVLASLTSAHEFSSPARGARSTRILEASIRGLCEGLSSASGHANGKVDAGMTGGEEVQSAAAEDPKTPPRRVRELDVAAENASPGGLVAEPVTSLETYYRYIYGERRVENAPLGTGKGGGAGGQQEVRVLSVRRKKKKAS